MYKTGILARIYWL